jgi:Fe-S cluster assembly ATP-binding protein
MTPLLETKNLTAGIAGKEILKDLNLSIAAGEVHAIMGPNAAGKSTLGAVLTGRPDYQVFSGSIIYKGRNLLEMKPEERAWAGVFMSFQYPIEIPGVSITALMKAAVNAKLKAASKDELTPGEFLKLMKEKMALLKMRSDFAKREVNVGFSGGEKKRSEIFQMAMLDPTLSILDETDSGLDVDALKIVADGVNTLRSNEKSTLIITHYKRLLELIKPDVVHVLRDGRIIATGGFEIVDKIENEGYDSINE